MDEFRFDNVRLILADSNRQMRHGLKGVLYQQGFRDIIDTGNLATVQETVERNGVDLMVCDADVEGGDICALTHRIRHHKIGNNPFLVVLILSAAPTEATVGRIVNSGADDLVAKPFSPETLIGRIKALARGRKPFVVTHDYIGPDRRRVERAGRQTVPFVEVPNPLRLKAVANAASASLQRQIDASAERVNLHKMERYAVQIGYLANRVVPHFGQGKPADGAILGEIDHDLGRLSSIAEDLGGRIRGTQYAHAGEVALSLQGVAQRIRQSLHDHGPAHDVELLPKIAQSLQRIFGGDSGGVASAEMAASA